jgi:hypothetical protein
MILGTQSGTVYFEKSRVLFIFFDSGEFGASGAFPRTIAHYDVIHHGEAAHVGNSRWYICLKVQGIANFLPQEYSDGAASILTRPRPRDFGGGAILR